MKLAVFSPSLGGGGAERHLVRILPSLSARFETTLYLLRCNGPFLPDLPSGLVPRRVEAGHWTTAAPAIASALRGDPADVVLSFQDHMNVAVLAAMGFLRSRSRPATAISVQNTLSRSLAGSPRMVRMLLSRSVRGLYPRADLVIAISQGVADDLGRLIPDSRQKTQVIFNAGMDERLEVLAKEECEHRFFTAGEPVIVACGRLTEQKDYPTLLRAFATLRTGLKAKLIVCGDGPLRDQLTSLASALGLADSVDFIGFVKNPFAFLSRAGLFVLSSRWEGFANVVAEALACGTPVVATDCPSGPAEILDGGKFGLVVPPEDPDKLAAAMRAVLSDAALAAELRSGAQDRARSFSSEIIGERYACALASIFSNSDAAGLHQPLPRSGVYH
jgi:glycosyltransferase involved in cell wall biosynthesis